MANDTRWHVIRPPRLVYAAPSLLYAELFIALLGIAVARGNFLGGFIALAITHPLAIWLTTREPHMDAIVREWFRRLLAYFMPKQAGYPAAKTRNTWRTGGNSFVP